MITFVIAAVLLGLAVLLMVAIQQNNAAGLKEIPSAHFSVPFTKIWILSVRWRSVENRVRADLHRRLGPVVRIGPREISVDGVDDGIRIIYSSKFAKGDWWQTGFSTGEPSFMVIIKGNEEHRRRKRLLTNVYSKSYILRSKALEASLDMVMNIMNEDMLMSADNNKPIEAMRWAKAAMMDVTSSWCFGTSCGTNFLRDTAARNRFLKLFKESWSGMFWRFEFPWIAAVLPLVGINVVPKPSNPARTELALWHKQMTVKASAKHKPKSEGNANVYDHFYDNLKRTEPELSLNQLNDVISPELYDHLVAGHNSGGLALMYAMYELSRSPAHQHALRKEVQALLSAPTRDRTRAQRIEELPLLDTVVLETLRVRPPSIGPSPRETPPGGALLAGRFNVPGGTVVSSSAWTLHGNARIFPAPWEWRPERWLNADRAQRAEMNKWFWAFGNGARMCIGNHMVLCALKEALVSIYTNFETLIDEDLTGRMEQADGRHGSPIGGCLYLRFRRASGSQ